MPLTSLYFIVLQSPFLCIQIHSLKFKQAQHLVFPALFEQLLSIISIDVSSGIPSFPTTTLFKTVCISKQICQFSLTWTLSLDQVLSATPGALTLLCRSLPQYTIKGFPSGALWNYRKD